jgi:hypothetical protein
MKVCKVFLNAALAALCLGSLTDPNTSMGRFRRSITQGQRMSHLQNRRRVRQIAISRMRLVCLEVIARDHPGPLRPYRDLLSTGAIRDD